MADNFPPIDPSKDSTLVLAVGRKGSGKSHAAQSLFVTWPSVDRLIIDPNGDVNVGGRGRVQRITEPPKRMPARSGDGPAILHYVADTRSPTYRDDLDRVLATVLYPRDRPTLVWVDEAGQVFPAGAAGRGGPLARTLLQQSRHHHTSAILCCPRPIEVDPLAVSQADRVLIFDLPHPRDRERIAANIGWPPKELDAELAENRRRGPHWFLMYIATEHALYRCPPLPEWVPRTFPDRGEDSPG